MTREKRYKIIAREIDFVDGVMSSHFDDYGEETHRALKEAVEIINSLSAVPEREKGEWIPVSERLPEPEDKQEVKVIVSYENEDGEFVEKGVFNKRYGFNFPSVKAWQPLPEPYKGESE